MTSRQPLQLAPRRRKLTFLSPPFCSTRRTVPLQPQCVALRWRCLPPGTAATTAVFVAPKRQNLAHLHVASLYTGRLAERRCALYDCEFRRGRPVEAVYISAESETSVWISSGRRVSGYIQPVRRRALKKKTDHDMSQIPL